MGGQGVDGAVVPVLDGGLVPLPRLGVRFDEVDALELGPGVHFVHVPAVPGVHDLARRRGFSGGALGPVDVVDQEATAADMGVPSPRLPAFDEEDFPFVVRFQIIVVPVFLDRPERMDALRQRGSLAHFEEPALHGAVVRRRLAGVVVVAGVHQVDVVPHRLRIAAAVLVVGVIQVGNAEGVRVFVAEGADGGERREGGQVLVQPQFRRAGVVVHEDAVPAVGDAGAGLHIPHVGPDIIVAGSFRLVRAGIEDEDVVHLAVPVVVIGGEIDFGTDGGAGVDNHLGAFLVLAVLVVRAVPGIVLRKGDDVGDVELERVAVLPLVLEIGEGRGGTGAVDELLEVVPAEFEFQVLELRQDDETVPDASGLFRPGAPGAGQLPVSERDGPAQAGGPSPPEQVIGDVAAGGDDFTRRVRIAGVFAGIEPAAVIVIAGVAPPTFRILHEGAAVRSHHQMTVFISGEISLDQRPVRLPEIHQAFPGGGGGQEKPAAQEDIEHQRQASQTSGFRSHTIQMTAIFRAFAKLYAKNRPHSRENRFFDVY